MTDSELETRLRRVLAEDAARAPHPARAPIPPAPDASTAVRARRVRRYGPIAVAAAVLVTITAGVAVLRNHTFDPGPASAGSARYFVASVSGAGIEELTVRDARTGRVTATMNAPAGTAWARVSAVADPHVFYAVRRSPLQRRARLYRLTIDDDGRAVALTGVRDLPFQPDRLASLAVSPDGTRVAFGGPSTGSASADVTAPGPAELDVMSLSSGRRTTFRTSAAGTVMGLSWETDGRHLAFQLWLPASRSFSLRVLDTRAGHDLLGSSRTVLTGEAAGQYTIPVLGADGRSAYLIGDDRTGRRRRTQIVEVDTGTGRRLRVLYEQPFHANSANVGRSFTILVRDPTGTALLATDTAGHAYRIDIASGRVLTLPFPRGVAGSIAW